MSVHVKGKVHGKTRENIIKVIAEDAAEIKYSFYYKLYL